MIRNVSGANGLGPPGRRLRLLPILVVFALIGCGGKDKAAPSPTAAVKVVETRAPALASATANAAGPATPQALSAANSLQVSDGVCVALVPDGWVDDGSGRGTSLAGASYALFGGRLVAAGDWRIAADLVVGQAAAKAGPTVRQTDDLVLLTYADDRGFEGRRRFADRYCDITVRSAKAIPSSERAYWQAIVDSMKPAP